MVSYQGIEFLLVWGFNMQFLKMALILIMGKDLLAL